LLLQVLGGEVVEWAQEVGHFFERRVEPRDALVILTRLAAPDVVLNCRSAQ
jgi:hypothetical protein